MPDAAMSPTAARVDPITASVIRGALENIAIEMGYKLMRMSYSSIIRESQDFGAALIDAQGNQLCETTQSTPLQSGPIPSYIRGMLRQLKARGDTVEPGDVIMHNDPCSGASHGPDVAFVVPVFYRDELIGFAVTTAHHLDIGALDDLTIDHEATAALRGRTLHPHGAYAGRETEANRTPAMPLPG